ncbi:MAG: PAS domain-containing protein [Methanobacteriota archaeon]|nr:MAG: PAS domain-containing protein [Euryarchaeota archaeon]
MTEETVSEETAFFKAANDLTSKLSAVKDAQEAYTLITERIRTLSDADYSGLVAYEPGRKDLRFVSVSGLNMSAIPSLPPIFTDADTRRQFEAQMQSTWLVVTRPEDVPKGGVQLFSSLNLGSVIASSIMFGGELIGYLIVARKEKGSPLTEREGRLLSTVANSVAPVIDHIRKTYRLARTQEETEKILSLAPIGMMTVDSKGMITSANRHMTGIMGVKKEDELLMTSIFEHSAIAKAGLDRMLMRALEGIPGEMDNVHFVPDVDKAFYLHAKVTPLPSETGEIESALLVALDMTSNVRLQSQLERSYEKLIQTYQELERVARLKTQFIDIVSHELRTPLTVLRGYLDLVESECPSIADPKLSQKMKTIRANADKLYALVESMLDISRLEKGTLQISPEPTKIDALLEEVVRTRAHDAVEKQQSLSLDVEGQIPLIMADRRRMRDVLNNIVDNAMKYTPEKGTIHLGARDEGKSVHIWVKDNGVGIPLENLGRIFDTFHIVASDDLSHEVNRIGLSLAISKGIVESHGGRIWVESQVGKGSVFHIGLPKGAMK